jgi:RsiW-degrading membrane proteinase PrsW (M82 family)
MAMLVTDKKSRPISATISIVATILTLGYMLPWMIAALRGKSNAWGVFVVNLLLGWTVLGWIIALVMSCTSHQVAGYGLRAPRR